MTKERERTGDGPHTAKIDTSRGHLGVTLSNIDFGKTLGTGVVIEAMDAKDLVAKAGLREGDVILAINGEQVTDHRKAFQLIEKNAKKVIEVSYSTPGEVAKMAAKARYDAKNERSREGTTTAPESRNCWRWAVVRGPWVVDRVESP